MTAMWRKRLIPRQLILSMSGCRVVFVLISGFLNTWLAGKATRERVTSEELPAQLGGLCAALRQVGAARQGRRPDDRLSLESAPSLFADLTPPRLGLLDTRRLAGACSVYALAKAATRNDSNVHTDLARLAELGLIARQHDHAVSVPFDAIGIRFPLAPVA